VQADEIIDTKRTAEMEKRMGMMTEVLLEVTTTTIKLLEAWPEDGEDEPPIASPVRSGRTLPRPGKLPPPPGKSTRTPRTPRSPTPKERNDESPDGDTTSPARSPNATPRTPRIPRDVSGRAARAEAGSGARAVNAGRPFNQRRKSWSPPNSSRPLAPFASGAPPSKFPAAKRDATRRKLMALRADLIAGKAAAAPNQVGRLKEPINESEESGGAQIIKDLMDKQAYVQGVKRSARASKSNQGKAATPQKSRAVSIESPEKRRTRSEQGKQASDPAPTSGGRGVRNGSDVVQVAPSASASSEIAETPSVDVGEPERVDSTPGPASAAAHEA